MIFCGWLVRILVISLIVGIFWEKKFGDGKFVLFNFVILCILMLEIRECIKGFVFFEVIGIFWCFIKVRRDIVLCNVWLWCWFLVEVVIVSRLIFFDVIVIIKVMVLLCFGL